MIREVELHQLHQSSWIILLIREEILAPLWSFMFTVPLLRWFRGLRSARFLQTLQAGPSNDGDHASLSNDNEEGLSVVRLQVAKAYWAYAPCTMPHTSEPYITS